MRSIVFALTLALGASVPLPATAQAPVTTQPLAAGEVLVEVSAIGMVTTRADRVTLSFAISGGGETEAAARAATETGIRDVRATLRGLGVADADIDIGTITISRGDAMANSTMGADVPETTEAGAAESATGSAATTITIRNPDRVAAIQAALAARGIFVIGGATYALNDDAAPRRQARGQALANARADAEAYAAALNMRVVRIVRVTERLGLEALSLVANESQLLTQLFSPGTMLGSGPDVPTMVVVGVDFALAPR